MNKVKFELLCKVDPKKLLNSIEYVRNLKKIEWGGGVPTGEKTEDGKDIFSWPYPIYSEELADAMTILGFDEQVADNYKAFGENPDINKLSVEELQTYLTLIMQGERFCDGLIGGFATDGRLLEVLERIEKLFRKMIRYYMKIEAGYEMQSNDYLEPDYIRVGNMGVSDVINGREKRTREDFINDTHYRIYLFVVRESARDLSAGRPVLYGYIND